MKWSAVPYTAVRALRKNAMRTALTALGIIIGVGAVITMVGLGQGAGAEIREQVNRLGQNVVLVFPGERSLGGVSIGGGSANTLTVEDALALRDEIPEVIAASPEVRSTRVAVYGNRNWSTRVYGQSHDYLQIRQWPIESGRMFTEEEVGMMAMVAVIGQTLVQELFEGSDPIGETIRVRGIPLEVIGVLETKGMSLMGSVQDDIVIVPYSTAFERISGRSHAMVINVQVYDEGSMEIAREKMPTCSVSGTASPRINRTTSRSRRRKRWRRWPPRPRA